MIKGLAHITGGGLVDNLPRVLPTKCDAVIETKSGPVPRIFKLLQEKGHVPASEMYQVFNMGIGMVVIVSERDAKRAISLLSASRTDSSRGERAKTIGRIERGTGKTRLVF